MCVTMVDPETIILEIDKIPTIVSMDRKGTTNESLISCLHKEVD